LTVLSVVSPEHLNGLELESNCHVEGIWMGLKQIPREFIDPTRRLIFSFTQAPISHDVESRRPMFDGITIQKRPNLWISCVSHMGYSIKPKVKKAAQMLSADGELYKKIRV